MNEAPLIVPGKMPLAKAAKDAKERTDWETEKPHTEVTEDTEEKLSWENTLFPVFLSFSVSSVTSV